MTLKSRLSSDEVLIYRDRSQVLIFIAALGLACLLAGMTMGWLGLMRASLKMADILLWLLALAFAAGGIAALLRIPRLARQGSDGVMVLLAGRLALAVAPHVGSEAKQLAWPMVEEIALAETLRMVESGETSVSSNAVIVFLSAGFPEPTGLIARAKSEMMNSGAGRLCLIASYPPGQGQDIASALRKMAGDAPVTIRWHQHALFDFKACRDSYAGA